MDILRNGMLTYHNKSLKKTSLNNIISYQRYFLSQIENTNIPIITQNKSHNKKVISLKNVFKTPKNILSKNKNWPKITKPKLPFSNRYTEENNDSRKNKIRLQKPSKTLHDFYTVKWLRHKYSDSVVEKSVLSLLPEKSNEIQMVYKDDREKSKRYQKMMDYLKSLKRPFGREKFVEINPKYLYNESTFEKILKLREIFLEFDQRKTQKMDFDEILNMFNQNHIKADKKDIADLFFKGKRIKKEEDIAKLNMGFFQFIHFALRKEQSFKEFMRKIKEKSNKNGENENTYLPMDFNLIMDYFINKEKERHSINKLNKAIDLLDNDIKNNDNEENININVINIDKLNNSTRSLSKKNKNINKEEKILSDVNILDLFNEFIKLFNFISKSEIKNLNNMNFYNNKVSTFKNPNKTKYNKSFNNMKYRNKPNITFRKSSNGSDDLNVIIKNQINQKTIKNMKLQNYNKYHDIDLAREQTLSQIKRNEIFNDNIVLAKIENK